MSQIYTDFNVTMLDWRWNGAGAGFWEQAITLLCFLGNRGTHVKISWWSYVSMSASGTM